MTPNDHLGADEQGILIPCPRCERLNRIPFGRLHLAGKCGSCKATLPHPALPVEIDSVASFTALTRGASLPLLVDFWAPWCGPCLMVAPEVNKLAALSAGELIVAKVNTEAQQAIAGNMGIRSIPTFAVFVGGREVQRTSGGSSATQLRDFARRAVQEAQS
jgi:thioredoxin 2